MTSYLLTMEITELDSKCVRGMNEQLLKTSCTDVLSSRLKLIKTLGIHPPPPPPLPLVRPRFNSPYIIKNYSLSKYVNDEN